jgi:hypothetical protein
MTKRKSKPDSKPPQAAAQAARGWGVRTTAILGVAAVVGVLIGMGWWSAMHNASPDTSAATTKPVGQTPGGNQQERADTTQDFQTSRLDLRKLKGQWVRTDGGYVIDIQRVDGSGKLEAAYLNPKPIHVAKAQATREGASAKVFIELQDVNYPGSTYDLVYDAQRDQLAGVYFQALLRQKYEVVFERQE